MKQIAVSSKVTTFRPHRVRTSTFSPSSSSRKRSRNSRNSFSFVLPPSSVLAVHYLMSVRGHHHVGAGKLESVRGLGAAAAQTGLAISHQDGNCDPSRRRGRSGRLLVVHALLVHGPLRFVSGTEDRGSWKCTANWNLKPTLVNRTKHVRGTIALPSHIFEIGKTITHV